jgi:hypothetical protein
LFLLKIIPLQDNFLNIPDEIEIKFPCFTRHLELVIKTYLDFHKTYLLCAEETLCVYGLDEGVDFYIDIKLKQYFFNFYQRQQIEERRCIFMEGYLTKNKDSFYSRELLLQHNISVEDPLTIDLSDDLEKKSFSLDIDNSLFIPPTTSGDDSSDKEIITILSNLIIESINLNKKDPITLFSTEKEIIYDPSV